MEHVRRRVAAGKLKAGDELPSVRELAQQLAVNTMTISKAYTLLEAEGVLERRRGATMRVARQHAHPRPMAARMDLLLPSLTRAAEEAKQLHLCKADVVQLFKEILNRSNV